ncbi:uncharacterized protein B0J16DRAFT_122641 [Fusarium flagelliforme]|uniref:Serine threonine protein kinase n=1 Tax=Fusarium flagelliforme TaxID=2675880 RepID=A0A395N186_9HYPO|nr:uncharacterized protein B0J16DRAFT_122641 [Fusarium flagelliforme]KAH7184806.1 hypothetical protein B0J16DRAFT_122641 [Fusarium flagelliforme]RFN53279.1 serine threonine protein kinase [Fusarium flagelliforme]
MVQLVALALYHRDHFSLGNARRTFGYEAYHWGILITPQTSRGRDCHAFEATDASEIDPVTFRMNNPTMAWWMRHKGNVDPALSAKLIGRIVIGQIPDGISAADLKKFFGTVPLPVKNTHPQESCVTWAIDAIRTMQRQGWVPQIELNGFKDWALSYADERMKGTNAREPSVRYYGV